MNHPDQPARQGGYGSSFKSYSAVAERPAVTQGEAQPRL